MIPNPTNLDRIKDSDLQSMLNVAREDRFIDFKEQSYAKEIIAKELCKDVAAFANTAGGCILIGIKEVAGVASELTGIELPDADKAYRQLQQVISSNIRPAPFVRFEKVKVGEDRFVLMIGIPASRQRPHMVTAAWPGVFYKRTDGGTIETMDTDDIRRAFLASASEEDEVSVRHHAMMNRFPVSAGSFLVGATVSPLPSDQERLDFRTQAVVNAARQIDPVYYSSYNYRHTFDGLLAHQPTHGIFEQRVMRSGTLAGVYGVESYLKNGAPRIPGTYLIKEVSVLLKTTFGFYTAVGISAPLLFVLSLKGCAGHHVGDHEWSSGEAIEQNELVFPPVAIDDLTVSPYSFLADPMNRLWQAGGYSACPFFDRQTDAFNSEAFKKIYGNDI